MRPLLCLLILLLCAPWVFDAGASDLSIAPDGIVILEVDQASALGRAGLKAQDVIVNWQGQAAHSALSEQVSGRIDSIFEWLRLEIDQGPLGGLRLHGLRGGTWISFAVSHELWNTEVRPTMPAETFEVYSRGLRLIEAGHTPSGTALWRQLAQADNEDLTWHLRCWLLVQVGADLREAGRHSDAERSYLDALKVAQDAAAKVVIWEVLGDLYLQQDELEKAQQAYRSELEIRQKTWGKSLGLAMTQTRLAEIHWLREEHDLAEALDESAMAIRKSLAPNLGLARDLMNLGRDALERGVLTTAGAHYRRALAILESTASTGLDAAEVLDILGHIEMLQERYESAEDFARRSLAIHQLLSPESPAVTELLNDLGHLAYEQGRLDEAESLYHRALAICESLKHSCRVLTVSLRGLGGIAYRRNQLSLSESYYLQGLKIEEQASPVGRQYGWILGDLGYIALERGKFQIASGYFERALLFFQHKAPDSIEAGKMLTGLGSVAAAQDELESAASFFDRARLIFEVHPQGSHRLADILDRLGDIAQDRNEFNLAAGYYHRALEIYEKEGLEGQGMAGVLAGLASAAQQRHEIDAARYFAERALAVAQAVAPESFLVIDILDLLGGITFRQSDYKEASSYHEQALVIRQTLAPQSLGMVRNLDRLASNAMCQGQPIVAVDYRQRAVDKWKVVAPDDPALDRYTAKQLTEIGMQSIHLNQWAAAERFLERALELQLEQSAESPEVAGILDTLGAVAFERGDFKRAEGHWLSALSILLKIAPESPKAVHAFRHAGLVASARGDHEMAEDYYQRALAISRIIEPNRHWVETLNSLGRLAEERGELEVARGYYAQVFEIWSCIAPSSLPLGDSLVNMSAITGKLGQVEESEKYSRAALDIYEASEMALYERAHNLDRLGYNAQDLGNLELAKELYLRALKLRQEQTPEDGALIVESLRRLGSMESLLGDFDRAANYHERALDFSERVAPMSTLVADSLDELGRVAQSRGDLELAMEFHQRALAIYGEQAPDSLNEALTLQRLGEVFLAKEDLPQAVVFHLRAIEVMESQLGKLGGSYAAKGSYLAQHMEIYRDTVELLLKADRAGEALHVLERFKGKSFLTTLAERELVFAADVGDEIDRARREIASRYDETLWQLASLDETQDREEFETLSRNLRKLQSEQTQIISRVREASPRLASLHYPQPLALRGIQQALDSGTVLLSYNVRETGTDVFCVGANGIAHGQVLPIGEEDLRRKIMELRDLVLRARTDGRTGAMRNLLAAGHELYKALIEPVAVELEESQRVLIIPDGPLHLLPWSLLVREVEVKRRDSDRFWQYFVEWRAVHTALSATVYAELKNRDHGSKAEHETMALMAFGDPVYPSITGRMAEAITDVRVRAAVKRGFFDWQRLAHTRREVELISSLFPSDRTRVYLGAEANEATVKSLRGSARIIHFAAHAYLDDHFPMNSALALSIPGEFSEDQDNGLLQAWEIFEQLRIDADLVVLSACSSALGQEQGGEGLIGITRAFQFAGARSVIASLWDVDDESTAELMVRFYRHLLAGKSKDEALRSAQVELAQGPIWVITKDGRREERDFTAPSYWAAFQLYGDWQ